MIRVRHLLLCSSAAAVVAIDSARAQQAAPDEPARFLDPTALLIAVVIGAVAVVIYFMVRKPRDSTMPRKLAVEPMPQPVVHEAARVAPTPTGGEPSPVPVGDMAVFVSYRRNDSADVAGRIYDRLVAALGAKNVFKDVDAIPIGVDFRAHLSEAVQRADVVLAVIGPQWAAQRSQDGGRRIDDERDYVRIELSTSLARGIPVVPVLVGGAQMPAKEDLPPALADLAFRNAVAVRSDPDFHTDLDRLIRGLKHHARSHWLVARTSAAEYIRIPLWSSS